VTEPNATSTEEAKQTTGSEFGSPVADKVYDLLADPVATVGGELIDVEWTGGTLRLVIDGDGGITTGQLAEVNRLVSPLLDQHDPVPGRYLLEVSSPGVERPLRRPDHFRRAVGEQVIVKLESWSEIRRVRGELLSADENGISVAAVETDGVDLPAVETHELSYDTITQARTHFEWGPTPKKGGSKGKSGSKGNSGSKSSTGKGGSKKKSNPTKGRTPNKSSNNKRKKR